jgi:hypothetical protein
MSTWNYTQHDKGCRIAQTSDGRFWLQYGSRQCQYHRNQDLGAAARGGRVRATMVLILQLRSCQQVLTLMHCLQFAGEYHTLRSAISSMCTSTMASPSFALRRRCVLMCSRIHRTAASNVELAVHPLFTALQMFGKRLPFAFLEDIKTKFFSSYTHSCKEVRAMMLL